MTSKLNKKTTVLGVSTLSIALILSNTSIAQAQEAKSNTQTSAQTVSGEAPKAEAKKETVTVIGKKPTNRVDRQSYDVTNDIAAQTGSAADALNKVPAVTVDADGNVALRGNQNVQILINGKQNAMMKGENRGSAILSMAGGDIESVEVMNTPGAAFSSEGSGGIINLVMKKNRRPGKYLTLTSTAGEDGRFNLNTTGSYNIDKFNFTGGLNYRKDGREVDSRSLRISKKPNNTGVVISEAVGKTLGRRESYGGNVGLDYNMSDNDTFGLQLTYMNHEMNPHTQIDYKGTDAENQLISDYDLDTNRVQTTKSFGAGLNFEHKFKMPNQTLKADLRFSNDDGETNYTDNYSYILPSVSNYKNIVTQLSDRNNYIFSLDYNTPVGDDVLTSGLQVTLDDAQFDNVGVRLDDGASVAIIDPTKTNKFEYTQSVVATYFTYQKQLDEKWGAQVGVRVEDTETNTLNPVSGVYSSSHYNNVSPSAFATYQINEQAKLRFSYSRRIQRPRANDLNPTPEYQGAESIRIGNPNLRPMTTDAFEAGYEWAKAQSSFTLRGFYRLNDDVISTYSRFLTDNLIETSAINAGQSTSAGVEVNLSRKFFNKLTTNINSTISYTEQDALYGTSDKVTGTSVGARMMLDYAMTNKDRMQLMLGTRGKEINAQGYSTPQIMSMVSYSRQINPAIYFVANVTNPFDLEEVKTVTETDVFKSISYRNVQPRVFYVGFRVMMGARPKNAKPETIMMGPPPGGHRPPM